MPVPWRSFDVLGENHDSPLKAVKERVTQKNVKLKQLEQEADSVTHSCYDVCPNACPAAEASILASQRVKHHQMACHPGFTIAFDNIDFADQQKEHDNVKAKSWRTLGQPQNVY